MICVDCKKKELVGDYANGGAEWEPEGSPTRVGTHDFPDPEVPKAIPYGVYDIGANEGWVNVGDDHDTPAFAVASIARWWERMGRARYPDATRLMITADAGGSNGYRAACSKPNWPPSPPPSGCDHRLPHAARHVEVEQNRAPPLLVHLDQLARQAAHHLPDHRRAHRGHHHHAPGCASKPTSTPATTRLGQKITDAEFTALPLDPHEWHGDWNYTVHPP